MSAPITSVWHAEPNSAVIVVDVQRDFCPGGSLAVPNGDDVVGASNWMMSHADNVYVTRDWHPVKTPHFDKWPPHCIAHTVGAEFHPNLWVPDYAAIIYKGFYELDGGYSAFGGQDWRGHELDRMLHNQMVNKLYVMGLATDYCVKETVLQAIRYGYKVEVILDAVAAVNLQPQDGSHAIQVMSDAGAKFEYAIKYGYLDGLLRAAQRRHVMIDSKRELCGTAV